MDAEKAVRLSNWLMMSAAYCASADGWTRLECFAMWTAAVVRGLDVAVAVLTRGAEQLARGGVLESACATVGNLALEPAQKQSLKRLGAAQLVERAMQSFPGDGDLQSTGCMALNNLM